MGFEIARMFIKSFRHWLSKVIELSSSKREQAPDRLRREDPPEDIIGSAVKTWPACGRCYHSPCGLQCLPAYLPDLSPPETRWSKVKESSRIAGARPFPSPQKALKGAFGQVTESDIKGGFLHRGDCIAPK